MRFLVVNFLPFTFSTFLSQLALIEGVSAAYLAELEEPGGELLPLAAAAAQEGIRY
jgi:hypothetical protein